MNFGTMILRKNNFDMIFCNICSYICQYSSDHYEWCYHCSIRRIKNIPHQSLRGWAILDNKTKKIVSKIHLILICPPISNIYTAKKIFENHQTNFRGDALRNCLKPFMLFTNQDILNKLDIKCSKNKVTSTKEAQLSRIT